MHYIGYVYVFASLCLLLSFADAWIKHVNSRTKRSLIIYTSTIEPPKLRNQAEEGEEKNQQLHLATNAADAAAAQRAAEVASAAAAAAAAQKEVGDGGYDGSDTFEENDGKWDGYMDGFDWQLEQARRLLEGPSFAPLRMTLWQPPNISSKRHPPGLVDSSRILLNNALQILGAAESLDGAPLVQGVNTFKGSPLQLLSRVADGNLQELAGGPLFLLLWDYYRKYGPVYKLAFGPKYYIVLSDPVMVKQILKDNPNNYDKGILAEILEPIMGKGLIPADPETWKVRRKAIVPGFHKAWLNAMVSPTYATRQPLFSVCQKYMHTTCIHKHAHV